MSDGGVRGYSARTLEQLAASSGLEARGRDQGTGQVSTAEGSFGGRVVRFFKVLTGTVSEAERTANKDGHLAVLKGLQATFGDEIGTKAFRAHFGKSDGGNEWATNTYAPITGRHVAQMLSTAKSELAQAHDVLKMRQISIGGMAGPFSKGVCQAATTDWFRRIDGGLPSWASTRAGSKQMPPEDRAVVDRKSVDWERKRERLQTIQDKGQAQDSRFQRAGSVYARAEQLDGMTGVRGRSLENGNKLADAILGDAGKRLSGKPGENAFFQLDINIAGRLYGHVGHTIGIHVVAKNDNPQGPQDFEAHVFDANEREARSIPGEQLGAWLASHSEARYGDRVRQAVVSAVEKQPIEQRQPTETSPLLASSKDDF